MNIFANENKNKKTVRVAINGFGRIGRLTFRKLFFNDNIEIIAINDPIPLKSAMHLLRFDTTYHFWKGKDCQAPKISFQEDKNNNEGLSSSFVINNKRVLFYNEKDPNNLPWAELEIDLVIEASGFFTSSLKARAHINAGAKKVVITAPAGNDLPTIVYNVNHKTLKKEDRVISAASCTTNCLAPVVKLLNDTFGVKLGYMTTVHAVTLDQKLLDASHSDLRRARAAFANLVPSSTGAAAAIGLVIPELKKTNFKLLDGLSLRYPALVGSLVDLSLILKKKTSVEEINRLFRDNISETLAYNDEDIVSSDIIGSSYGSIFDATLTQVVDDGKQQLVKVFSWYDNESSFVAQLIRTVEYFAGL